MAFTERQEYKLEVLPPYSVIQVRRADIVEKDGVEVGRQFHRHCVAPGADVSAECDQVKSIVAALWTPDVINAYQRSIEIQEELLAGTGEENIVGTQEENIVD